MDWLNAPRPDLAQPYAVLIPGCSPAKPAKRWPARCFANLAQSLFERGITPVLAGTAVDQDAGEEIKASVPAVIDKIGQTSLMDLAALLRDAALVVAMTPVLFSWLRDLHAPTLMVMSRHTDPSMSAPFGDRAGWIKRDDITTITADMVLDAAEGVRV